MCFTNGHHNGLSVSGVPPRVLEGIVTLSCHKCYTIAYSAITLCTGALTQPISMLLLFVNVPLIQQVHFAQQLISVLLRCLQYKMPWYYVSATLLTPGIMCKLHEQHPSTVHPDLASV